MTNKPIVHLATLGPTGWLPIAPGTWGSLVSVILWWLLLADQAVWVKLASIILATGIAVWSSSIAEKSLGHDAGPIVIDELVGQWIALIISSTTFHFTLAFVLFRIFDIWKPYPVKSMEKYPWGWGIVLDDAFAGLYALLTFWLLIYL